MPGWPRGRPAPWQSVPAAGDGDAEGGADAELARSEVLHGGTAFVRGCRSMAPAVEAYVRERQAATRGPRSDPVPTHRPDLTDGQRPESLTIEACAPEESKAEPS